MTADKVAIQAFKSKQRDEIGEDTLHFERVHNTNGVVLLHANSLRISTIYV
jgi:hypothetical protein